MHQRAIDPQFQRGVVGQVGDADHPAAHLVLVGRADAAPGGADLGHGILPLAGAVQLAMEGQDQRRVLGDHQRFGGDVDTLRSDRLDLVQQMPGVQHHAVADHAQLAAAHHARGQRVQLVDLAVDHQRVPGVMAALKARDHIRPLAQPVHDLAFTLVAPLGADHNDIGHQGPPISERFKPAPVYIEQCASETANSACPGAGQRAAFARRSARIPPRQWARSITWACSCAGSAPSSCWR